jgi:hypothetical protein
MTPIQAIRYFFPDIKSVEERALSQKDTQELGDLCAEALGVKIEDEANA